MHEFEDRDLEALRATRGGDLEMNTSETAIGRARLEREVVARGKADLSAGRNRRRSSKRFVPVVAIGGLVAAAALGVALLPPAPIAVKAEAAQILLAAAEDVEFKALQVASGQYLRVERSYSELAKTVDSSGEDVFFMLGGKSAVIGNDLENGSFNSQVEALYHMDFIGLVGANQTAAAEETARGAAEDSLPVHSREGLVVALGSDGARLIEKNSADQIEHRIDDKMGHDIQYLESLPEAPRDPASLRQYILSEVGPHETSDDQVVFEWVRQLIFDPIMPAELRAAGFKVLAELQGATINDDQVKIGNRVGTSLSFSALGDTREDLVFDRDTGVLLGAQTVLVRESDRYHGIPVGTVVFSVELDTSVDDHFSG